MFETNYSAEQVSDAHALLQGLESVPAEHRLFATMLAEAFLSGMEAHARLTASAERMVSHETA